MGNFIIGVEIIINLKEGTRWTKGSYSGSGGQGGYGGSGGYNSSDRGGYGGYSSHGYQYSNKIEYPKNPKPPGTDH